MNPQLKLFVGNLLYWLKQLSGDSFELQAADTDNGLDVLLLRNSEPFVVDGLSSTFHLQYKSIPNPGEAGYCFVLIDGIIFSPNGREVAKWMLFDSTKKN